MVMEKLENADMPILARIMVTVEISRVLFLWSTVAENSIIPRQVVMVYGIDFVIII